MSANAPSGSLVSLETWIAALTSSACIGFTSLIPWLFNMTFFEHDQGRKGPHRGNGRMEYLLSFSVGAILGDIFFHLVPESLEAHLIELSDSPQVAQRKVGLSIIAGIFMFIIVEMLIERWSKPGIESNLETNIESERVCAATSKKSNAAQTLTKHMDLKKVFDSKVTDQPVDSLENNNNNLTNCGECLHRPSVDEDPSHTCFSNNQHGRSDQRVSLRKKGTTKAKSLRTSEEPSQDSSLANSAVCQVIDPAGYLSLIANGFDNFTHGLAIGASFLVGPKVGLLTTFVIIIHEIPHEICDYAILVNSGFTRWDAVKAQSSVSLFGTIGTAAALYVKSVETLNAKTVWILPFSAGGFLHIALVNLLPEILGRDTSFRDLLEQIGCVILGIAFMGAVALV